MAAQVSVEDLKPQEVSLYMPIDADRQSRFTGEGADLNLLHWLRHAEQAIEQLESVSFVAY